MSLQRMLRNVRKGANYGIGDPPPDQVARENERAVELRSRQRGMSVEPLPNKYLRLVTEAFSDRLVACKKANERDLLAYCMKACRGNMNPAIFAEIIRREFENIKKGTRTVTMTNMDDVARFESVELTEGEMRALLGDSVYEEVRRPGAGPTGTVTVTSIDRDAGTLKVEPPNVRVEVTNGREEANDDR
jgi:hypothetical protein